MCHNVYGLYTHFAYFGTAKDQLLSFLYFSLLFIKRSLTLGSFHFEAIRNCLFVSRQLEKIGFRVLGRKKANIE